MEIKKGRFIDHVHLRVTDLDRSAKFYEAVAKCLGIDSFHMGDGFFTCDELFVSLADDSDVSRVHLAFQTNNRAKVEEFYNVALANSGKDNGKPGERSYHPGYYAAYVYDPDGHNIEAVNHGEFERSTEAVVFTADNP